MARPLYRIPCVVAVLVVAAAWASLGSVNGIVVEPARKPAAARPEIFIVPHSHDDTGWQRTVDQYHVESVRYILTETVKALLENRNRTFVEVEIAFFKRWWDEQDESVKADVKQLVANGQLEFINGGWCMADEAVTHFDGVVNQLTVGHNFLKRELGVAPRFGWSIDPFGASATFAAMFADMGYEGFVINRIHYLLKTAWQGSQHLEFTWRGTPSRNGTADMFTHVLDSHYSAPWGFDWEYETPGACNTFDLANTNPSLHEEALSLLTPPNLDDRAQTFVTEMKLRASYFRTPNVLVPFGDDFKFKNPQVQFRNMDMLMEYINANEDKFGIHMRYATVGQYFDAVKATNTDWPMYEGDFFPYAFAPDGTRFDEPGWASADSYWAGFYTSRPQLKGWARNYDGLLHGTELAFAVAANSGAASPGAAAQPRVRGNIGDLDSQTALEVMREVSGVLKHHDAETGTSVPYVVNDFLERAAAGTVIGTNLTAVMLTAVGKANGASGSAHAAREGVGLSADPSALAGLCQGGTVPVVLYNSLARLRREVVQIGIDCDDVAVTTAGAGGQLVAAPAQVNLNHTLQVQPIPPAPTAASAPAPPPPPASSKYNLFVLVDIPPVGYTTVFLTGNATKDTLGAAARGKVESVAPSQLDALTNGVVTLDFDAERGELAAVTMDGVKVTARQQFMTYDSETDWPDSTAYIFRPSYSEEAYPILLNTSRKAPDLVRITGPLVQEVIQTYNPTYNASVFVQQTLRLYSDAAAAAGTAPATDLDVRTYIDSFMVLGMNHTFKELITRFTTDLDNAIPPPSHADATEKDRYTFYTDANGIGIKQREYMHPYWEKYTPNALWYEPVAMNYYPAATATFIRDESGTRAMQLTVVSDRAHGAGCLGAGQLEVMLHRRNSVSGTISLDDTSVLHTRQAFSVAKYPAAASAAHRALSRRLIHPVEQYFGIATATPSSARGSTAEAWAASFASNISFVSKPLPANVALQSFDVVLGNTTAVLLRLRHMFAAHENPVLSQPVTVDLVDLVNPALLRVTDTQPLTLNANKAVALDTRFVDPKLGFQTSVLLNPLETKTFMLTVAAASP